MMLADDDLDVDAEIVGRAQDFDHAPHRALAIFGIFQQLDVDDHAVELRGLGDFERLRADAVDLRGRRGNRQILRNLDPVAQPLVVRHHEKSAAPHAELTHHRRMRAPEDLDDLAVSAPAGLDARDARHYAIAVHGAAG